MMDQRIAKRYGRALFNLALREKILPKVRSDMSLVAEIVEANDGFSSWLSDATASKIKRLALIDNIEKVGELAPVTLNFLKTLIDKERFSYIEDIIKFFLAFADEEEGIVNAEVVVADKSVQNTIKAEILNLLEKKIKKKVNLSFIEDRSIIGGMILKFQDTIFDASIKRSLDEIRERLCQ